MYYQDRARVTKISSVPKKYYSTHKQDGIHTIENLYNIKGTKKNSMKRNIKRWKMIAGVCAAVLSLTTFTVLASSYSVGYTVVVEDTVVGTVATKTEYYQVLDEVKTEVKDISDAEFEVSGEETFHVELVKKDEFTEKEELAENLKSISEEMIEAFGISYNGTLIAALASQEEADAVLSRYLAEQTQGADNITAEFVGEVIVSKTLVLNSSVKDAESVYAMFSAGKTINHTVAEGETIDSVAAQYGVLPDAVVFAESDQQAEILAGQTLTIYTNEPMFSIKTVEHVKGEFEIPFEITSQEDAGLYSGKTQIDKKGKNGLKFYEAYVTKIDGVVTEESILQDTILRQPKTQVQRVGTKKAPASVGTGTFVMPTSGTLTSKFGSRWGRTHAGIDLAAKEGTPIYAADNGVVTESAHKNNGYGKLITIDHGNGYITFYAHCSSLLVSEGDVVAKGDLIGRVGNTGRSTGPHLHFEIRKDGTAQNPLSYVK